MPKLNPTRVERAWFLPWNAGWTHSVAFLGGNQRLAAGNQQGGILLWDLPGTMPDSPAPADAKADDELAAPIRKPVRALEGHTNLVSRMGASPDGRWLYSSSWDHTVRIWDTQAKPEGKTEVVLFDQRRGDQAKKRGLGEEDVAPVEVELVRAAKTLDAHSEWVHGFSMTPDRTWLVTGDDAGLMVVWDIPEGKEIARFQTKERGWARGVAIAPDGKSVFYSEPYDRHREITGSIGVWDVATGEMVKDFSKSKDFRVNNRGVIASESAAYSPDGARVAMASSKVVLLDAETGEIVWSEDGHKEEVRHVAFSGDGEFILSAGRDTQVRIRQAKDGKQVAEIGAPRGGQFKDWIHHFDLSPDEQWLATADMAGMAHVWHFTS
ncbi:MAG: hypothetical protein WD066_10700 [Planctomycetaceae bacterium]